MSRTMEVDEEDFIKAIMLLDACQEALDAASRLEQRREAGKPMRCITDQERAKAVASFVPEIVQKYGMNV